MGHAPAGAQTFGLSGAEDWTVRDGQLVGPDGVALGSTGDLPRALPHDIANSLAASAAAMGAGADAEACRAVLRTFQGLPHRVQLVSDAGGVRWYDDSKATTPASVVAALRGFDSVVLIAGGRNKGLDMGALTAGADRIRCVIAIGDAAGEVAKAFDGVRPVETAASMKEAVARAREAAQPGDAVLLSPGCASFDWYSNYAERGDDFARLVREQGQ
jgi:UDP-N-acetylmuramoylalanine--D-glutamate ligase